jgi:hypothetical protein
MSTAYWKYKFIERHDYPLTSGKELANSSQCKSKIIYVSLSFLFYSHATLQVVYLHIQVVLQ